MSDENMEPTAPMQPDLPAPRSPLSERTYAGAIGVFVVLGLGCAAFVVWLLRDSPHAWYFAPIGIVGAFMGLEITTRTLDWRGSAVGHMIAHAGFGLVAAPVILLPGASWLRGAAVLVGMGAVLLTIMAWLHPVTVRMFGTFAVGTIAAAGAVHILDALLPAWTMGRPGLADILIALAFLGHLDAYWTRALKLPHTADNAADSACALFVDALDKSLKLLDRRATRRIHR